MYFTCTCASLQAHCAATGILSHPWEATGFLGREARIGQARRRHRSLPVPSPPSLRDIKRRNPSRAHHGIDDHASSVAVRLDASVRPFLCPRGSFDALLLNWSCGRRRTSCVPSTPEPDTRSGASDRPKHNAHTETHQAHSLPPVSSRRRLQRRTGCHSAQLGISAPSNHLPNLPSAWGVVHIQPRAAARDEHISIRRALCQRSQRHVSTPEASLLPSRPLRRAVPPSDPPFLCDHGPSRAC